MNRRQLLGLAGSALFAAPAKEERVIPDYEKPMFNLHAVSSSPVKIKSIDLLRIKSDYFMRVESADGVVGLCQTKQVEDYVAILQRHIVPAFLGKDARDLETLIDDVYIANYKMAGQPFWAPVAYVEQCIFDVLGKTAKKPVGALIGGVIRKEIPVYLSGGIRETTAEEEVEIYARGLEETGAKAMKFKIGGRMSRNLDAYPGRTETMIRLARKRFGDKILINADANGSYNAAKGIEVGKFLESMGVNFFEEPCPWEELGETKEVADALKMPVSIGEQDASLWRFKWIMDTRVADIVQPDLNYNGGFIRACRVAKMAREHKMQIVPHNTQTGATAVNILQFASAVPNIGGFMEFPHRGPRKPASWYTPNFNIKNGVIPAPTGPGLGIEFDPDYMKQAVKVTV